MDDDKSAAPARTGNTSSTAPVPSPSRIERKEVNVYDIAELTAERATYWLAMDGWTVGEAAHLLNAVDPRVLARRVELNRGSMAVSFPMQFDEVQALLRRASEAGALRFPALPADVIEWAMTKKLRLPAPLIPDGAEVHSGRWVQRGANADDPRHDPEEALRHIKAAQLTRDMVTADDADDEARELVRRENEEKARRRAAEAKRIAEGRYFIDEAAKAIAQQRGLSESWAQQFRDAMLKAAEDRALTVRDPSTWLPIPQGRRVSLACIVTRADVNAWLDAQGAGYQWEGDAAPDAPGTPEGAAERQCRRLDRLQALGGDRVPKAGGGWKAAGTRGALAALAREEAEAQKPYSNVRDVARDLDAEADRRRASRAMPRG